MGDVEALELLGEGDELLSDELDAELDERATTVNPPYQPNPTGHPG
jgi:hypothetical protein